ARMVDGTEPWLAEHARRDLELLAAQPDSADGSVDLVAVLAEIAGQAPVSVRLDVPHPMPVPRAPAAAIGAAVREALTNVGRHAGVDTAEVVATRVDTVVVVEVADRGRGFSRDDVPPRRRGVAESIEQRMTRVGGHAVVTARPGGGTVVRLEWPRG
ncbi:MAG: ATP-binding protein, partial [Actinomycetota bacterium]|nr:ATP-binding protein [Actinomycetota bacterium]